jgi:hypothetical protein
MEQAFRRGRIVFLAFFVLCTQGLMVSAHNFIVMIQLGPINVRDIAQDAINAASAGFVLLSLTNFALIILLGKDFGYEAPSRQYHQFQQSGLNNIQFQTSPPV